uniref:BAG family molecular chaperone regulator 1-like n=1 Tax=Styela clava TaxID=7725 RepID=UPI00193A1A7C|nr:BAG family molecular chaperone regulator 1-like [Styela clava]
MDLILVHGATKHLVHVEDDSTVDELMTLVTEKTQIPNFNQKLIYKGVAISKDNVKLLKEFKIKNNSKIMVIGQRHDPEEESILKKLAETEKTVEKMNSSIAKLNSDIDSVKKGFMEKSLLSKSIERLQKILLKYTEDGMQAMEFLDGMKIDEKFKDARLKKKSLINKIQTILDKCDIISDNLSTANS